MKKIPDTHQDLLNDELKSYAFLSTLMNDGTPQVTPVWFSWDGENLLINSAKGRTKDRNMRSRPDVAVAIQDPRNPYRYLQIRGKVVEITEEGARDHINFLNMKYNGSPLYGGPKDEVRVIYKIQPLNLSVMG
jgi:PPOX class probable F420-dependent enzyme